MFDPGRFLVVPVVSTLQLPGEESTQVPQGVSQVANGISSIALLFFRVKRESEVLHDRTLC